MTPTTCPIWGTPAHERPRMGDQREILSSRAGGRYAISGDVEIILAHLPLGASGKERLTEWIEGQRRQGKLCPLVSSHALAAVIAKG
jgi:hypothetical protein